MQRGFVCASFVIWRTEVVYFQTGSRLKCVIDHMDGRKTGLWAVKLFHLSGVFPVFHSNKYFCDFFFPFYRCLAQFTKIFGFLFHTFSNVWPEVHVDHESTCSCGSAEGESLPSRPAASLTPHREQGNTPFKQWQQMHARIQQCVKVKREKRQTSPETEGGQIA